MTVGAIAIGGSALGPGPSAAAAESPTQGSRIAGCTVFPANNVWHARVDRLPVDAKSATYVSSMGREGWVLPNFGSGTWRGRPIGMPITTVAPGTKRVPVHFRYTRESDPGPYPIPRSVGIEGGPSSNGDRHVLVVDSKTCTAYELHHAYANRDGSWEAVSGARWDLSSNALRPKDWTSADAAGLPIMAGLVRYDEVAAGHVDHAVRMTVSRPRNAYIWPARHRPTAGSSPSLPPLGQRFRLKASYDISHLPQQARVIAQALKTYGAILADGGPSWMLSGPQDDRWSNSQLRALRLLKGKDFEAVNESRLMVSPDSAAVRH
jgi:hypothetical protein